MLELNKVYCGDCLEIMKQIPDKSIDLVLTDPPYPDHYTEEYKYFNGILNVFKNYSCKQLIFWTAKSSFPLNYTAIHIWDKKCGCGSEYEMIFERNGGEQYKVFRYYLINSTVAAQYTNDTFTGHKSQKPIHLISDLIQKYSKEGDTVLDPFLGSGTTAVACEQLNRKWIGIEISPEYCAIARERIAREKSQLKMDLK